MDSSDLQNETPEANNETASPVTIQSLKQSDETLTNGINGIKSSASKINMLIENLSKSNSKNLKLASESCVEANIKPNNLLSAAETLLEIKNKSSSSLNRSDLENRSNLSYDEENSNNSSANLSQRFCDDEENLDNNTNNDELKDMNDDENLSLHSSINDDEEKNILKDLESDNEEAADNANNIDKNNTFNDDIDGWCLPFLNSSLCKKRKKNLNKKTK
jgi:hypothetical protein